MKFRKFRMLAACAAICIATSTLMYPNSSICPNQQMVYAKTIAEIDAEKQQKQNEIAAKQAELQTLSKDIANQEQYQTVLQEKIDLINSKLLLIDSQLTSLNNDIAEKETEITSLEAEIAEQQSEIDTGLDEFKARIRTLYVHGNDSLLSALVGATDFYDVLAKLDLINRIAKHDDTMVKELTEELNTLAANQEDLRARVQALNLKVTETEVIQKEFNDSIAELNDAMSESNYVKQQLEAEQAEANAQILQNQAEIEELQREHDAILEEAARKEEERRRKAEEEERRRKEEEERAKQTTIPKQTTAPNQTGGLPKPTTTTTTKPPSTTTPPPSYNGGKLAWPAPGFYYVSSEFAYRWGRHHNGIDIAGAGIHGSNACAATAGTVLRIYTGCAHDGKGFCGCNYGWGNYVVVSHGNGLYTLYAHLKDVSVSVGSTVSQGTVLGHIGATGNSTGYHLHFGVMVNSTSNYVNPRLYLN